MTERPGDLERRSTPWQPRISEPDHSTDRKGDQHRDQHPEQSEEKYRQDRNLSNSLNLNSRMPGLFGAIFRLGEMRRNQIRSHPTRCWPRNCRLNTTAGGDTQAVGLAPSRHRHRHRYRSPIGWTDLTATVIATAGAR